MRRLIILLIFLVASVWLGLIVMRHPGYLLLVYQPWMVQMPLWFALLAALLIFGLFYFVISSIDRLSFLWFRIKNWIRFRREQRSYSKTQHGLATLIEGRWKKAERLLLSGMNKSIDPLINYLGAAKAAQELNAFDRRDRYIQKAYQIAPDADMAIGLTQAELELKQHNLEQATAILNRLRENSPRHPRVLKSLEKIYVRTANWEALQALLPSLRKAKLLTSDQFVQFEKNMYIERLQGICGAPLETIHKIWDEMPRYVRKDPDVIYAYVKCLIAVHNDASLKEAEELIRKSLNTSWHQELAVLYGNLPFTNLNRQLVIVGAWLKMYGPKPELLLTLGKLCVGVQLWGKAKDYFEKCLSFGPNPAASLEYGKLLEQLGEPELAIKKYREGLMLKS